MPPNFNFVPRQLQLLASLAGQSRTNKCLVTYQLHAVSYVTGPGQFGAQN